VGFLEGYKQGKVITFILAAVIGVIVILLVGSGVFESDPPEVGDKMECLYTTRAVSRGEAASMEMFAYRDAVIDSPAFSCVRNILAIKGNKFVEDVAADTLMIHVLVKDPRSEYEP